MAARVHRLAWADVALHPAIADMFTLGLGSGLTRRAGDVAGRVFAVTDRGPNLFIDQALEVYGADLSELADYPESKIMPFPREGPEIVELEVGADTVRLVRRLPLMTRSGRRLGGGSPWGGTAEDGAEMLFDVRGAPLAADALGADTEAVAAMPDGSFWVAEEYGPSLIHVDAAGVVMERWAPSGRGDALQDSGIVVRECLPGRAALRRPNRGLEALCASAGGRWLYAGFQSALRGEDGMEAPVWKLDALTGELAGEWRYPFDTPESFRRDAARRKMKAGDLKICEFAWTGDDRLLVMERIAHSTKVYAVDLARLPEKRLLVSSDDFVEIGPDIEGMTMLSPTELLLASDNDFGVEGAETGFWRVTLDAAL